MGCFFALILMEMLKGGVWAGLGMGPGEMKPTAALSGGQCPQPSKQNSVVWSPSVKLYHSSPVIKQLAKSGLGDSGWWVSLH